MSTREERIQDFKVIGAGLGRTGTNSLRMALDILGVGPCYNMSEVIGHNEQWIWKSIGELKDKGKKVEWDRVFSGNHFQTYRSTVDFPTCAYYRELMEYYPNSKVILSVRKPEKWYNSFYDTIATFSPYHPEHSWLLSMGYWLTPTRYLYGWMESARISRFFGKEVLAKKENTIKAFNEWTEEVKRTVPERNLLIFYPSMGWEPLCKFLGVPIPEVPYPSSNSREVWKKRFRWRQLKGLYLLAILPLSLPQRLLNLISVWWKGGFRDVSQ